ncbi:hypothetical protein CRG98_034574, partial [Punica granatum]
LLSRASLVFCYSSSPSQLARASCNLAGSAHPCELNFLLRKFAEPYRSCLLQPCLVYSPVRVYFSASEIRRASSLVPLATLPGLLSRAILLFCFASSPSLPARASCNLAGSTHPKFAEPDRSCLLQPCRVYSLVRVYFSASQVRRACSLVPLATLPGLLTRASLLFCFARSPSQLARASCNLAGATHSCEFTFLLRKIAEPARSCLLQPCRFSSPVRAYFFASEIRRAISLQPLATLSGLLTRASLLFCLASSPSQLAGAFCNLAGSARPCEFTFLLSKIAEPARWCLLQPCRVCSPVRFYFSASQVHRACPLVPLATLPGLLTRASLLFCFEASSPSQLARASCNLAGSAHPCEFTFLLSKFAEPARSCLLQPCRVCSPTRVCFSASQVRRACSFVPLTTLPGLLTSASLLFSFLSSPSQLARASYNLASSSPSQLARASCNLAGSAHPREFTFLLRKIAEPARSCLLQPCRVCSPARVYFSASQDRRASSLVPLATLPGLLTHASLLFCFASSSSMLVRASYNLAGSAHQCEFTFLLLKFAEPARSCLLQLCLFCSPVRAYSFASEICRAISLLPLATLPGLLPRAILHFFFGNSPSQLARASCNLAGVCSPMRVYFSASQVHRACSLVPLATLPVLLTRASLHFCFGNSPSHIAPASCNLACHIAPASCNLAWSGHLCEFTILLNKFAEPARSCLLQPGRVCSPVRVYFSASQVRIACSLVPLATSPVLLTRASLLFGLASSPSQLAGASFNLAGSAHPCEFTFLLSKIAEPARSCLLRTCRVCSPVRFYFSASQVNRACSLVPLATLPSLLTREILLFCFASSPSQLARAPYNLVCSAHPCELTFLLRKFAEPFRSCLLQPCLQPGRVCPPVRFYFSASQVHRACSLVPLATLPGLLTRASLLFCLASSPSQLAGASFNLAGSAHPCDFTFLLRKFTEPARSCLLQPCRVCSPVRIYLSASQVRRARSLVPLATLPVLLTRASLLFCFGNLPSHIAPASCNLASKFAELARSCLLQPCRICSPVRVYFSASHVRRACSLVPLVTSPVLLTRASLLFCLASSPSQLARASYNLGGSANPCEFTFQHRKFAEPPRSCLLQPWRQVRRASSLVPLLPLPDLLSRAILLFCFASSPSLLARASCNLARSALPCEFTFLLSKIAEPARSCLLQPRRVCSPVRVYFSASQVRRACSLVPLATLPGLLSRASLLFCLARSPSQLARASCNLAGSVHPCEFTFLLRKFVEPARSCLLQPCQQDRRASSLVPLATSPGLFTRASLLFCFASSSSLLARASCNLARSALPCEFTFLLSKIAEPARSCLLQPRRVCSPVRVYFSASQVRRACSLVPLATLPGLLSRASLLFCLARSPSQLARASCNLAGSVHPCEFTFLLRKFVEPARSCLLQPCQQDRRASSLVPLATSPGLFTRASLLFCFASSSSLLARASCNLARSALPCEFTFLLSKIAEPARSCLLQPRRVCSPVRVYFSASQVRRACSLVPLATLPGLLSRASLLFCLARSPSQLARASCNLAGSVHPCEFTFLLRKFVEPARSCLLQPCQQDRRASSLVPLATSPGLFTRASLLFCFASSSSLLARASCNLARSALPCEFTFLLSKIAEPARSCLLQPRRVCSPVRVYFSASQVRRACSLVPLATLPGLLSRASLLFCLARSPSQLARASCNLAASAHRCEFTFLLRKFPELARSCFLQPCRVCSPVRVNFSASQVRRACSLVPLATLPGLLSVRVNFSASEVRRACSLVPLATLPSLLTDASLLFCFGNSPSHFAPASCNLAWSNHPCEFTFLLSKFAEPARSCLLQPCRFCSPVRVYFSALEIRRAISLQPLATLPGLLSRASLLFCLASSPSQLARASCNLAGSPHPCELTFLLRKFAEPYRSCLLQPCLVCPPFAEPARSCLLQPCRVCSPVRVNFSASQVRRACSLVPLATLPGLLSRASLLFCLASSPSQLARASCNLAGSAHPSEFTFVLRKFAEPARPCLLQPCLVCLPMRAYFSTSEVRRASSLLHRTTLPGLLYHASLLFRVASSLSQLARASCNFACSARPSELTFSLSKFAEPARSCLLQPCRVCSPVRVYFCASQVRRACSPLPLTTLPGLLTHASLLFYFGSSPSQLAPASYNLAWSALPCEFTFPPSSPSQLARASCNLAGSAHPSEFTFVLRKFAEPARPCLLQPCLVCLPMRAYFSTSEVRRASSLLHRTTLPGLLYHASLLFRVASSLSQLARASCNFACSARPSELTFSLSKFAEPARSCLLQPCRVCSPVRVYFCASQVRRACSPLPLTTLPGLLTHASLLFYFGSSPSQLAPASYNLACSPSQLARASCNLAGSAHPSEFTFVLRKFAEPARPCLLQPCLVCLPMRAYFSTSEVRRASSLLHRTTLPGLLYHASLLFRVASSLSQLARASCNFACSARPSELTFSLSKFAEPARSCLLQPCRVCSPVRVYFCASQVRRACSPLPLTTLPGLLTHASLLFYFGSSPSQLAPASYNLAWSALPCEFTFPPSSPSQLARASCNLAGSAHPSEFTFVLRKFAEPARPCLLQPCLVCLPMRAYFSTSEVRRASSLLHRTTLPGLLYHASLLFRVASSLSQLARASCNFACSARPSELTFSLSKFAEPARSCLLQPCRVCSPVRVYFCASQVRRACSPLPLTTLPGLLTHASLLFYFGSSPSQLAPASYNLACSSSLLARASCNLAESAHPCEFTFPLRKFPEPARSCLLQPCRVCSPKVPRACSLVLLATLPSLLTRANLLFCLESSPSLLARASCNLAESAHPCEFTFLLRKFPELARSCFLQPCRVCSPVRIYFSALQVRRACSLVPVAALPGLLSRPSLLLCFASWPSLLSFASCNLAGSALPSEFTFVLRKFVVPARPCLLQPCLVCSPMRAYFSTSEVRRACSLVPLATLPGLLTRASLLLCFASWPSLLSFASCNHAGSAPPSVFTFVLRKFAVPARHCLLQPCLVCSPMRAYFSTSEVRRASSLLHRTTFPGLLFRASLLFCFASSPSLLARASCNLAGSAHPCELTFLLRKFAEPARSCILSKFVEPTRSCLLQPCAVWSPVRVYFSALQVRRACSLVPLATLPGLLTRASLLFCFASSPGLLDPASCNLAKSTHPCEFSFLLRKFAELARSCLLQPCRVCSPVRVYFSALQVRRACSLVPHATLPGLLTRASLLFHFGSSQSMLARASYNLAGSTH